MIDIILSIGAEATKKINANARMAAMSRTLTQSINCGVK